MLYLLVSSAPSTGLTTRRCCNSMLSEENKTEPWGMIMFRSRKRSHGEGQVRVTTPQSSKGLGERIPRTRRWPGMLNAAGRLKMRLGNRSLDLEKHSSSMRKEWRFKGLRREGVVRKQFFPDLTTTAFDIHPSFTESLSPFWLLWCNILTSPQIPSRAPCSPSPSKCQGFKGSVFSSCLCLLDKLAYSWQFQWCLPLDKPPSLSPAWESSQGSGPYSFIYLFLF